MTTPPEESTRAAGDAPTPATIPETSPDLTIDRPGREPGELVMAMSPRQILGGFALLAALIVMVLRRGRRKH